MKKASIFVMIVTVLSKLLGFVRETVLAATFGPGAISDAFIYSFGLPTKIFSLIAAAFVTGFIPMFTRIENQKGKQEANTFLNNVVHVVVILCAIISGFFFIFTEFSLSILLPSASQEALVYLIPFTKVTVFSVFFTSIIQIFTGFLQIRDSFVFPMMMGFPMNIVVIGAIYMSTFVGTWILPFGILISYALQATLILGYSRFKGYRYQFVINFKDPDLRKMLVIAVPLIIGASVAVFGGLVNEGIVSGVDGGISYLNYSTRVGGLISGIFATSIVSVTYPGISRSVSLNKVEEAKKETGDSIISILLFVLPSIVGITILAEPVLRFIYVREEFTEAHLQVLVPIFVFYTLAVLVNCLRDLIVKVFYAYQDTRTPMYNSILTIGLQASLAIALFNVLGVMGVTLAMSISHTISLLFLTFQMKKLFNDFPLRYYIKQILKLVIASVLMGVVVYFTYRYFSTQSSSLMAMFISIIVGIIVYLVAVLMSGIDTVDSLIESIRYKLKG
ncbi:MAG: murein biosynthesis integral membrane protein MurJ [Erysipelothrix sp.]|nr:murein biosynthesis integral membrane protein MurJ [Erysipelothrix sp.]